MNNRTLPPGGPRGKPKKGRPVWVNASKSLALARDALAKGATLEDIGRAWEDFMDGKPSYLEQCCIYEVDTDG